MRFRFALVLTGLLAAAAAPAPTPDFLVVPGRSLGHLQLGAATATLGTLGKAAFSDGAMQKAWGTWYGHRPATGAAPSELDVYTAPQGNDVDHHTVQVIRATSPWFHLANGLRPGSSLADIRAAYGPLPLVASFRMADGRHHLYDDVAHGIAFETDTTAGFGCCQAVIVHGAGKALLRDYLPMPEYLKQLPPAR